ncbi:MAG: hypothetical protein ACM3Y9_10350 [Ignavibacteria bacterium]
MKPLAQRAHGAAFLLLSLVVLLGATGCAHPIVISPNLSQLEREASATPIQKNVGYYISVEKRSLQVTTGGGGGDSVSYKPYADIETAFYKTLSNVFADVTVLQDTKDAEAIGKRGISYVLTPSIVTTSSSPSPFTWPPTYFRMELSCSVADTSGKPIATKAVIGEGRAEFNEFKSDFALSAKRAVEDALKKLQAILLDSKELRTNDGGRPSPAAGTGGSASPS